MSLNRAQIIGNLTRDPEVRQTPSGTQVASFTVATNYSWKDQQGQKQEKTEFHNIVAWSKLAEICQMYLKKGKKIFIEGRIQTREWEADDGTKRYKTEIVADNMIMLSGRSEGEQPAAPYQQNEPASSSAKKVNEPIEELQIPTEDEVTIDDLPF